MPSLTAPVSFIEIQKLKAACRRDRERIVILLMLETGATASELSRFASRQIDWTSRRIWYPGRPEGAAVSIFTVELLSRYFRYRDLFAITARQVQRIVAALVRRAGLGRPLTPRALRGASQAPGDIPPASMFSAMIEAAVDAVLVTDDQRRYVYVNRAALRIMEAQNADILGRRLDEFFEIGNGVTQVSAWSTLLDQGSQYGVYRLLGTTPPRVFVYSATASFAPGLHLLVLRDHAACGDVVN